MKIYLLIGLPGAGKSHWLKGKDGIIFDDISQIKNGVFDLTTHLIEDKSDIYISDVNFCEFSTLFSAINKIKSINKNYELNFILFNSTREISINNVNYRDDERYVLPTIERFHNKSKTIYEDLIKNGFTENIVLVNTPKMPIVKKKII